MSENKVEMFVSGRPVKFYNVKQLTLDELRTYRDDLGQALLDYTGGEECERPMQLMDLFSYCEDELRLREHRLKCIMAMRDSCLYNAPEIMETFSKSNRSE